LKPSAVAAVHLAQFNIVFFTKEIPMSPLIFAGAWLLVFGGVAVASISVANAADRSPRGTGLFSRFVAAMIESRQRQAQRVIDRYRAIDGHRARPSSRQPNLDGASSRTVGPAESEGRGPNMAMAANGDREQPLGPLRSDKPPSFAAAPKIDSFVSADNGDCLVQVGKIR
jgi:hypothetical protein